MTQVTNYAVPNGPRATVRQAFNAVLAALRDDNSGPTAPLNPVPGMVWRDTSTSPAVLRVMNDTNTEWITAFEAWFSGDAEAARDSLGLGTAALLVAGGDGGAGVIGTAAGQVAVRNANGLLDATARGVVRYSEVTASGLAVVTQTIPAWVSKIEIQMRGLSSNAASASISAQATVGGVAVASNYFSTNTSLTNATNPALSSQITTAAVLPPVTGASVMTGDMILTRLGSTNTWLWKSKATGLAVGATFETSGVIDLAGPLDGIRLFPSAGNWDAGIVAIEGRA